MFVDAAAAHIRKGLLRGGCVPGGTQPHTVVDRHEDGVSEKIFHKDAGDLDSGLFAAHDSRVMSLAESVVSPTREEREKPHGSSRLASLAKAFRWMAGVAVLSGALSHAQEAAAPASPKELVAKLGSPRWRTREEAHGTLQQRLSAAMVRGVRPSWHTDLDPAFAADPEIQSRLADLQSQMFHIERQHTFTATQCEFPHGEISVDDALRIIEHAVGRPVRLHHATPSQHAEQLRVPSGDLWQAILSMKLSGGKRLMPCATDGGLDLTIVGENECLAASNGAVLSVCNTKTGQIGSVTEPGRKLWKAHVERASMRTARGVRPVAVDSFGIAAELPRSGETLDVEIVACASHTSRFAFGNLHEQRVLRTPDHRMTFEGLRDDERTPGNTTGMIRFSHYRPSAPECIIVQPANEKGADVPVLWRDWSGDGLHVTFEGRPHTLAVTVQHEWYRSERRTCSFKGE